MSDGVKIVGLRETIRDLERLGVEAADLKEAFGAISRDVETEAEALVKVKTGAARATIRATPGKNKAVVTAGSAGVPYVGVLNYGWPDRGIAGDEFLTGPANSNTQQHVQQLEDNLEHLIRKYDLN